ncbi:hypothetical protein NKDENANG_00628 [Candidatus Entotheonellaceae bacterium PAL068K]
MDEHTIVQAVGEMANTLGSMALTITHPDDPLALPEPPGSDEIETYEGHINTLKAQVEASYHPLLNMSLRDYRAGYPDRAGSYLKDFMEKLIERPDYSQTFSAESQSQLDFYLTDLREL